MKGSLSDKGIVVFSREAPATMEGPGNDADGLELSSGVANRIFVDGKGLGEEFVTELFKASLIGYLTTHYEEAQR